MLKKTLLFGMALCLLLPAGFAAAEEALAVNFQDTAALISYDGEVLVEPGRYDSIFALEDIFSDTEGWDSYADRDAEKSTLFSAGIQGENGEILYALLDAQGQSLTRAEYQMLSANGDGVIFLQEERYGAMTAEGAVVIEPEYTMLVSNGEGGFLALTTEHWDDEPDGVYWIDAGGNASATGVKTMSGLSSFSEGLMPALSAENQLYGYLNARGQWQIRPQFDFAGAFSGDYAVASLSTGFGLIDQNGNWVVTPKYEYLSYEKDGLILAQQDSSHVAVLDSRTLAEKFVLQGEALYCASLGNLVQAYDAESVRLYNADGALINESDALSGYSYGENGQSILFAGAWGEECVYLLGAQGETVAGPFQALSSLDTHEGVAYYTFMTFDAQATYSEELGENLYDWDEESVLNGVIDEAGRLVLPAEYEEMYRLARNRIFVRKGEVSGVISLDGNWIYRRGD